MEIDKLFKGIAVIIDDEINDSESTIRKIKGFVEEKNILVATYDNIPDIECIPSLANVSFVMLDWEFKYSIQEESGVELGAELIKDNETNLIEFIKKIMETIFVPIFIFTNHGHEMIKKKLIDNDLNDINRIFIKSKEEVTSSDNLFEAIGNWIKKMPSAYVLKEWEQVAVNAKNKMFLDMYSCSQKWVQIIWKMVKDDSIESHKEFSDFVTRNFANRIDYFKFQEEMLECDSEYSSEELVKVLEGERFIKYNPSSSLHPSQAYTGDLFLKDGKYYLNLRAQCDLARARNPELYCIKGKVVDVSNVSFGTIKLENSEKLILGDGSEYSLDQLKDTCRDEVSISEFNSILDEYRKGFFYSFGDIICKKTEVVITCVAGKKIIKFRLDLEVKKFNELKKYRIGRILPPYITRIQQNCSQYIVREGIMPIPKEIFSN